MVLRVGYQYVKKKTKTKNLDPYFIPYTQVNSEQVKDINELKLQNL